MATHIPSFHIVGDAFVDLLCFLESDLPSLGGDASLTLPVTRLAGGSANNTATHLTSILNKFISANSANVSFYSSINPTDDHGKLLLAHAESHGYKIVNCRKEASEESTGHCIVMVTSGERTFMTHLGCMGRFRAEDVRFEDMASGEHVHLHVAGFYNIPGFWNGKLHAKLKSVRRLREQSQEQNTTTTISLVPQHDATGSWDGGLFELFPLLDFLIMNDMEAQHIAKIGDEGTTQWDRLADFFGSKCKNLVVIVTRGKEGAIAMKEGRVIATQKAVVVDPVDTTGAGDAFVSGFLHGIWRWRQSADKWPIEAIQQGLLWGCSVATTNVMVRGASVPSCKEQIESVLNETKSLE